MSAIISVHSVDGYVILFSLPVTISRVDEICTVQVDEDG